MNSYRDILIDIPAVNISSGEPGKSNEYRSLCHDSQDYQPPEVSCLYSVISRRSAVALLEPFEFMVRKVNVR